MDNPVQWARRVILIGLMMTPITGCIKHTPLKIDAPKQKVRLVVTWSENPTAICNAGMRVEGCHKRIGDLHLITTKKPRYLQDTKRMCILGHEVAHALFGTMHKIGDHHECK